MKNLTPLQVVIVSSILLAVFAALSDYIYDWYYYSQNDLLHNVVVFFLIGIFSFVIFYIMLHQFIYRKIKIIYKSIYDFKVNKVMPKTLKVKMTSDILRTQAEEVEKWAMIKKEEISKLQQLQKFRSEFLANVSHELKTPLFNIQGYIETLIDGGLNDPDINISYLQKASKNVSRMNSIIKDLETITSLDTGKVQLFITQFHINELITEVADALSYQAKNKNITIRLKKNCNIGLLVEADKEKIKEVLFNLISNAIRYGKEYGKIQIGCYDMVENILVEVSDNGIGIEKKHLPHLFERFYRVDKDRSKLSGGTGLGLSIVKHIMEAHNQSVHVRSTVGIGTTLGFTLKKALPK